MQNVLAFSVANKPSHYIEWFCVTCSSVTFLFLWVFNLKGHIAAVLIFLCLSPLLSLSLAHRLSLVQFEGAEWDRSSSPTDRLRPTRSSPLMPGSMKFRKPSESLTLMGERVDPTLPLEKQVYVQLQ